MKIQVRSDLHLEFGKPTHIPNLGADVLILAGDVMTAVNLRQFTREDVVLPHEVNRGVKATAYREFLDMVSRDFKHVIYVAGNHEFYHGKFFEDLKTLKDECTLNYGNIHFLENDSVTIDGITFVGATLWTNCNGLDAVTMQTLQFGMNDYRIIKYDATPNQYSALRPKNSVERHIQSLQYINAEVAKHDKVVVVTHHAPTFKSIDPQYVNDQEFNGGYASDLSNLILDHPNIKLWCHGHIHAKNDYMVGTTRVYANPMGYPGTLDSTDEVIDVA